MEVEYIIDSAVELGEITPLECCTLHLNSKAYARVDQLIAENRELPKDFLVNTARMAFQYSTPEERHWIALNSVRGLDYLAKCIHDRASYIVQSKVQYDLCKAGSKHLIEHSVENGTLFFADRIVSTEEGVTETAVRAILNKHMGSLIRRLQEDNERINRAIVWYQADNGEAFRRLQMAHRATRHSFASLSRSAYLQAIQEEKARKRLENKRPVRGAIKKVCKLFAQFRQEDNLRLFVSGKDVELSHPDSSLKFIVRPLGEPGWLEDRSAKGHAHTPYDLSVYTKDDIFLAKLCVYFSDTPVLDQLLALAIFVQAGDELKVLEKANFYAFAEDHREIARERLLDVYPSLESKFPKIKPRAVEDELELGELVEDGGRIRIALPAEVQAEQAHWEPFKGRVEAWVTTWMEPVFSQLLPKANLLQLAELR